MTNPKGKRFDDPQKLVLLQGAETNKNPICCFEVRRKSHPDSITSATGSMTIQSDRLAKHLSCPSLCSSTPSLPLKGSSSVAPCHPFASPTVAQVPDLHCPWSGFSTALSLASWQSAMQTCTTSAVQHPPTPLLPSFPAHWLHTTRFLLCSSVFP